MSSRFALLAPSLAACPPTSPPGAATAHVRVALVVPDVSLAANVITTAIAIDGNTGSSTNPLGLLLCDDTAPASGLLAACTVGR